MKRFLLISDIHASDIDPASSKAPSYVSSYKSTSGTTLDPIFELEKLISEEHLAPDCILCAGDVTNRSLPSPFSFAWKKLNDLASSCRVRFITTIGNHDIDSRYKSNAYDPRGFAMSLAPKIPIAEDIFWSIGRRILR